jgi:Entner-Doudoroff aldolase
MTVEKLLEALREARATAIIRTSDQQIAALAMEAAIRGGFRMLEFTLTIPGALELIADFSRRPNLIVGAGTVLSPEDARNAVRAGARYIVSPVIDEEVIREGLALEVAVMPGTHTPTEMLMAHRAGAQLQKIFPALAGGPDTVRAILGPMPFLRPVPTNGVTADNAAAYLEAGAYAIAFVGSLFTPEDLKGRKFDRIEERARTLRGIVERLTLPA